MFQKILNHYKSDPNFSASVEHNLKQIVNHYDSITEKTLVNFEKISEKYHYSKRESYAPNPDLQTELEFYRGSGDYRISASLRDSTGPHENDPGFVCFIDECNFKDYREFDTDEEGELYYDIYDNLFYTWFAFLWQKAGGLKAGIVSKIVENNSSSLFFLNDFAWYDLSHYYEPRNSVLLEKTSPQFAEHFFKRDLNFEEIYSRTKTRYSFVKTPGYTRLFKRNDELKRISVSFNELKVENLLEKTEHLSILNKNEFKENQKKFINTCNELLNTGWKDISFDQNNSAT